MIQSGITSEGNPVISGAFPLVGTHGLPLENILYFFHERGYIMDWPDYIASAMRDGAKPRTIRARVVSAIEDIYGSYHRQEFEKRFESYFAALTLSNDEQR